VHRCQFTQSIDPHTNSTNSSKFSFFFLQRWFVPCSLRNMHILTSILAIFIASSLIMASPVALEKRANNGNVVVVTVTESITRTTYTAKHKVTRTVTVYAAMGEPMQRPARVEATTTHIAPTTLSTTIENPTSSTPSTTLTPAAPATAQATPSAAVVANDASAAPVSTLSSGLFSGQGTFYSTGFAFCFIPPNDLQTWKLRHQ